MQFLRSQLRLCYIADDELINSGKLTERVGELLNAGVTTVLFRRKGARPSSTQLEDMRRAAVLCKSSGRYCLTMDDTVLALEVGTHGVFFTAPQTRLARIREVLGPEAFVGVTANQVSHVEHLLSPEMTDIVDFVSVGPVLQFGDKQYRPLGVEVARNLTELLAAKPVIWMGGIRPADVHGFHEGFADGVAVVRSLQTSNTLDDVRRFHRVLGAKLGPCRWSVGHPPADHSFKFTNLQQADWESDKVPFYFSGQNAV